MNHQCLFTVHYLVSQGNICQDGDFGQFLNILTSLDMVAQQIQQEYNCYGEPDTKYQGYHPDNHTLGRYLTHKSGGVDNPGLGCGTCK